MKKRDTETSKRPSLFSKEGRNGRLFSNVSSVTEISLRDADDTNIQSTSSFRYDPYSHGLKNTQQLKVDYSKFRNHTFFNSAQAKTNVAFSKIINEFPFDGSRKDQ